MLEIVLVLCLSKLPDQCTEVRVPSDTAMPMGCYVEAQALAAEWKAFIAEDADWELKDFYCQEPSRQL